MIGGLKTKASKRIICRWAGLITLALVMVDQPRATADTDAQASLKLHLDFDAYDICVGDVLYARVRLTNNSPAAISESGTRPSFSSGDLRLEYRTNPGAPWQSFKPCHVWIEPGFRSPEARFEMNAKEEHVYYECLAFRHPPRESNPKCVLGFPEPGEYEFQALAQIGKELRLVSPSVVVKVQERPQAEVVAIDLGFELLRESTPPHVPGTKVTDLKQLRKIQQHLKGSRLDWHLRWKTAWTDWIESDDLEKIAAARDELLAMRDESEGIRRELLTATLAFVYLRRENYRQAAAEIVSLPKGAEVRQFLEFRFQEKSGRILGDE